MNIYIYISLIQTFKRFIFSYVREMPYERKGSESSVIKKHSWLQSAVFTSGRKSALYKHSYQHCSMCHSLLSFMSCILTYHAHQTFSSDLQIITFLYKIGTYICVLKATVFFNYWLKNNAIINEQQIEVINKLLAFMFRNHAIL